MPTFSQLSLSRHSTSLHSTPRLSCILFHIFSAKFVAPLGRVGEKRGVSGAGRRRRKRTGSYLRQSAPFFPPTVSGISSPPSSLFWPSASHANRKQQQQQQQNSIIFIDNLSLSLCSFFLPSCPVSISREKRRLLLLRSEGRRQPFSSICSSFSSSCIFFLLPHCSIHARLRIKSASFAASVLLLLLGPGLLGLLFFSPQFSSGQGCQPIG